MSTKEQKKCNFMCNSMSELKRDQGRLNTYKKKDCVANCTRMHEGKGPFNNKKALERYNNAWLEAKRQQNKRNKASLKGAAKNQDANNKSRRFTSEPIPDYIMRALKPKKSVHPEYGKLRY